MAKSHAQRQKEYRERKKAEAGSRWLQEETKRTKKYYKKISELSKHEAKRQRKKIRVKQANYRAALKAKKTTEATINRANESEPQPSTSYAVDNTHHSTIVSPSDRRLIVKIPKPKSSKRHTKKLEYLKLVKERLKKKNDSLRKSVERLKKKITKGTDKNNTPRSKAEHEMRKTGHNPTKQTNIRKKLIFVNCLVDEMKRNKKVAKTLVASKILKKYKLSCYAANVTGVRVQTARKVSHKGHRQSKLLKTITEFYQREDNSRQLPGKADKVKNSKKEHVQKFVLNDYLRNIYLKFKAEFPQLKVSFATFCRGRPKHVTLVNFAARVTCLCTKHQNAALKLQCLKKYGVTNNTSPDSFVQSNTKEELTQNLSTNLTSNEIVFKQWKRVKCDDGKQRTKLIEMRKDTKKFIEEVSDEFEDFRNHNNRVQSQFQSFKYMKESLKSNPDHVCIQMNFAENFGIKEREEIQSAYWNMESVTLHPVVLYYHDDGEVSHSSFVVVSEVLNHNTSMVKAIIEKVMIWVKRIKPDTKFVHYWTDSPVSQYRNKMIFDVVVQHLNLFGIQASWQYFEASHGKGACDGVGGVVKRSADTAIKSGKATITRGKEFYEWGLTTGGKIGYEYVEKAEYEEANEEIETRQKTVVPVKGTLKLHSVAVVNGREIMTRDTTCVCDKCFTDQGFTWSESNTCGWRKHTLYKNLPEEENPELVTEPNNEHEPSNTVEERDDSVTAVERSMNECINEGDFVAARYDGQTYIGKVVEIDDGSFEITFMESGSKVKDCLKWPTREDRIWIESDDIVCKVCEPQSTGKGKRFYKLSDDDKALIDKSTKTRPVV